MCKSDSFDLDLFSPELNQFCGDIYNGPCSTMDLASTDYTQYGGQGSPGHDQRYILGCRKITCSLPASKKASWVLLKSTSDFLVCPTCRFDYLQDSVSVGGPATDAPHILYHQIPLLKYARSRLISRPSFAQNTTVPHHLCRGPQWLACLLRLQRSSFLCSSQ